MLSTDLNIAIVNYEMFAKKACEAWIILINATDALNAREIARANYNAICVAKKHWKEIVVALTEDLLSL